MPDKWTLITSAGEYELNTTFSAPQYEAGGVSTPGIIRHDNRSTFQRTGDGLRTPGPLTLTGKVWRDNQNIPSMVTELNNIRDAVATCTSVTRTNNAGVWTYPDLAGGPTPEITPDGLGGWNVTIELWPGRAEPTFIPDGDGPGPGPGPGPDPDDPLGILAADVRLAHAPESDLIPIPGAPHPPGSLLIAAFISPNYLPDIVSTEPELTNLNNEGNYEPLDGTDWMQTWAFRRTLTGAETTIQVITDGPLEFTAHLVVIDGTGIADVAASNSRATPPGTATAAGTQLFMGALFEFGLG